MASLYSISLSLLLLQLSLHVLVRSSHQGKIIPLSASDKQQLLDAHNLLRSRLAKGQVDGQPPAADMLMLDWDDRLQKLAEKLVANCQMRHDRNSVTGIGNLGQNLAAGSASLFADKSYMVNKWFKEYKDYNYASKSCSGTCGHYTQVAWASTQLVGCGMAECPNMRLLACNYGPAGNMMNKSPYTKGSAASKCGGDFKFAVMGLCAKRSQCGSSCGSGSSSAGPTAINSVNKDRVLGREVSPSR